MAEYTSCDEVRLVLGRSTLPDENKGNAASLSNVTILEQIEDASQQIDSKLNSRWKVPFDEPVPKLIRNIARDIAAYLCDLVYREIRDHESKLNPNIQRYERAMIQLNELANGKATLPGNPPVDEDPASSSGSVVAVYGGDSVLCGDEFHTRCGCRSGRPLFYGRFE